MATLFKGFRLPPVLYYELIMFEKEPVNLYNNAFYTYILMRKEKKKLQESN